MEEAKEIGGGEGGGEPTARRPRAQGTGEAPGGRPGKPLLAHDRGPLPPQLIAARFAPACGTHWPWAAPNGHMASAWPPCPTEPRCGARRRRQCAPSHARPRWAAGRSSTCAARSPAGAHGLPNGEITTEPLAASIDDAWTQPSIAVGRQGTPPTTAKPTAAARAGPCMGTE